MKRMQSKFESRDSVLFLAMCWSGGGPFKLSDLHFIYDWINRDVLTLAEMEGTLNRLLAAKLIDHTSNIFFVPKTIYDEFHTYRRKKRKDRFEVAKQFLTTREPILEVKRVVRLHTATYSKSLNEYHKAFAEAAKAAGIQ